jgi:hypothetical protein
MVVTLLRLRLFATFIGSGRDYFLLLLLVTVCTLAHEYLQMTLFASLTTKDYNCGDFELRM